MAQGATTLKQWGFEWNRAAGNRLTKEFKCAKVRLEIAVSQFRDPDASSTAFKVLSVRKWEPKEDVL